jgi:hypothetical protein
MRSPAPMSLVLAGVTIKNPVLFGGPHRPGATTSHRRDVRRFWGLQTDIFHVLYKDGARSSNRKVPSSELGGIDGDAIAKPYIKAQDGQIAEISGRPRGVIRSVTRSRPR